MKNKMKNTNFKIKNERLFFNNELLKDVNNDYPFKSLEFKEDGCLGSGKNGTTFLVNHKFLKVKQVVKIATSDTEKNRLEAIKNANPQIMVPISDANYLVNPKGAVYSVMPLVSDSITLSEWIELKDKIVNIFLNSKNKSGLFLINQSCLNVASLFIENYSLIIHDGLTDGDMNPQNILVRDKSISLIQSKGLIDNNGQNMDGHNEIIIQNILRKYIKPGNIDSSYLSVRIIDLGTSNYEKTTKDYGKGRDLAFIHDNCKKILKTFFPSMKKKEGNFFPIRGLLNLKNRTRDEIIEQYVQSKTRIEPNILARAELRFLTFANYINGYVANDNSLDPKNDEKALNQINSCIAGDWSIKDADIQVLSIEHLKACQILYVEERKIYSDDGSFEDLINWNYLWKNLYQQSFLYMNSKICKQFQFSFDQKALIPKEK